MAEFLSQDEIDALLDIAEQGEDIDGEQEEKIVSKEKNYSIYDFKKPNRISNEQFKAFSTLHDKMLRDLITDLSAMLRKIVDIKLYSIEQMTYGEFILSIPQLTSLITLSLRPLDGRIVAECNPGISHKIIAELLGSGAIAASDNLDRELTEIEVEIFEHFYKVLVTHMQKSWNEITRINFKLSHETPMPMPFKLSLITKLYCWSFWKLPLMKTRDSYRFVTPFHTLRCF